VGRDLAQLLLLLLLLLLQLRVLQPLLLAHGCACTEHMLLLLLLPPGPMWFVVGICWQLLGLGRSSFGSAVHAALCCVALYLPCCCCCCVAGWGCWR
jgi:hypothetical protein